MKAGPSDKYQILAEINMVPLIDVSLVLLIIFMVMTPIMVKSQLKVNLPKAKAAQDAQKDKPIEIEVDKDGKIALAGKVVPADSVERELRSMVGDPEEKSVLIQADKSVAFEQVVIVIDAAKAVGITKLGIATMAGSRKDPDQNESGKPKPPKKPKTTPLK